MATTLNPLMNGSPFDEEGPVGFPREMYERAGNVLQLLESRKVKKAKKFIKEAEGIKNPKHSKPSKTIKPKAENIRASGSKSKRGPFGESYSPVSTPKKGERVKESRRFLESVSTDDLRGMLQRALKYKFPPKPPGDPYSPSGAVESSWSMTPYVKDIFPEDRMVVFTMKEVLWAADYQLDKKEGAAKLSNIRRVETKYVDIDEPEDGDEDDEDRTKESAPKGWEGTVKKMKKHKDIDNPFALANWMKNEGMQSHK